MGIISPAPVHDYGGRRGGGLPSSVIVDFHFLDFLPIAGAGEWRDDYCWALEARWTKRALLVEVLRQPAAVRT